MAYTLRVSELDLTISQDITTELFRSVVTWYIAVYAVMNYVEQMARLLKPKLSLYSP